MKRAFTLIELLVVIAIIAILAAILFPVFAQAKAAAKKAADISNLNQLGKSTLLYLSDYDDVFYPHRFNCNTAGDPTGGANATCPAYLDASNNLRPEAAMLSGGAEQRYYWVYMLQPYTKNYDVFRNPGGDGKFVPGAKTAPTCTADGCQGTGYGGQNSYGHNDVWLSPSGAYGGGGNLPASVVYTSVPRVASTIMVTDSTYYGVAPDVRNDSGLTNVAALNGNELNYVTGQNIRYTYYWRNIGGAHMSYGGVVGTSWGSYPPAQAVTDGKKLHGGNISTQFVDGHTKSIPYNRVVGDICLWTTDSDGAHPNCGG